MTPNSPYRYSAFVSYNRKADARLAPALQAAIQVFAKPWYRKRTMEIFRDETGMSMTTALWPTIERNLADSEHFVLLASPEAAKSRWVRKEIEWWLENRSVHTLHIVLTDGEIVWNHNKEEFSWQKTNALPELVSKWYPNEPGYADLRWTRTDSDLTLHNSKFRFAVRHVVASLQKKNPEEVYSEEARVLKRNFAWALSAAGLLLVMLAAAIWAAIIAHRQTEIAEKRARTALSRALAAESQEVLATNPALAHLLAVHATKSDETVEARGALLSSLLDRPNLECSLHMFEQPYGKMVAELTFVGDGATLVVGAENGAISRWDVQTHQPIAPPLHFPVAGRRVVDMALAEEGSILAVLQDDGLVMLWNSSSWQSLPSIQTISPNQVQPLFSAKALAVSPDGKRIAVGFSDGQIEVRDSVSGALVFPAFGKPIAPDKRAHHIGVQVLDFNSKGDLLVSGHGGDVIQRTGAEYKIWSLVVKPDQVAQVSAAGDGARAVKFEPRGGRVFCGRSDGVIEVFDVEKDKAAAEFSGGPDTYVTSIDVGSESVVASYLNGQVVVWDLKSGKITLEWSTGVTSGEVIALGPAGKRVATGGSNGSAELWSLSNHGIGRELEKNDRQQTATLLAASADGRWLAGIGNNQVTKWNLSTGKIEDQFTLSEQVKHCSLGFDQGDIIVMTDHARIWRCNGGVCTELSLDGLETIATRHPELPQALAYSADWSLSLRRTSDVKWGQETDGVVSQDGSLWVTGGRTRAPYTANLYRKSETKVIGLGLKKSSEWIGAVAVSRDGGLVGVGVGDGRLFFCDGVYGRTLAPPVYAHRGAVAAIEFRHDSGILASGSRDGNIVLWDVVTRQALGRPIPPPSKFAQVFALTFTENGEELAVSYSDGSLRLLDVSVPSWIQRALVRANRNLSQEEWRQQMGDRPFLAASNQAPSAPFE